MYAFVMLQEREDQEFSDIPRYAGKDMSDPFLFNSAA